MSIANFAKTVNSTALSVDGDRLTLANPTPPYQLPANTKECGYVVLLAQAGSALGCQVTQAEVIKYEGYEDDGRTLIITERGVGETNAHEWPVGALVTQPFLKEHFECIKKQCCEGCMTLDDLRANLRLNLENDFLQLLWDEEVIDAVCLKKYEEISDTGEWTYGSPCAGEPNYGSPDVGDNG